MAMVLLFSAIILFACDKEEVKREYVSGANGSVITETIDGKTVYRAVPDQWHEFVGWYNGNSRYSTNEVLNIKSKTPTKLEARFATSAKATFDRHLNSFYNDYIAGELQEGEYFNYSLSSTLNYLENDKNIDRKATINGYIDYEASSQLAFEVKDNDKIDFALYYDNNLQNGNIYIQIADEKYSYTDIGLLTNIFDSLPKSSTNVWKLDDLITDEGDKFLISQYFGVANSMGFINQVSNGENSSVINISYHKILNLFKNIANNSSEATALQSLIYALTCEYDYSQLPDMNLTITTNYEKSQNAEHVKDIEIKFDLNDDYIVNFDGNKFTLPKMNIVLKIDSFSYQLSTQANSISQDIISSFPAPTVNMINVHSDGEIDFVAKDEGSQTTIDKYTVEFDADLNPLALVSFKKDREDNFYDIEWEKLGFLSFKVSLVPETESTAIKEQQLRHNSEYTSLNNRFGYSYNDYINILIDTKNNGANVYVYLALYSPKTQLTQTYLFNHSFNIPALLEMAEQGDSQSNSIMKTLTALVAGGLTIKNTSFDVLLNNLMTEFLSLLDVDKDFIENNLETTENGFNLTLGEIRNKIRTYEKDIIRQTIGITADLELDKVIFGDDNITNLVVNMNKTTHDSVIKNQDNDYLSKDGDILIDEFNNAHKVIVGISNESGITELASPLTLQNLFDLKGKVTTISKAILSDGSEVSEFINNKGESQNTEYKKIKLLIEDIQILSKNDSTAKVRVLLQTKDKENGIGNFGDIFYNNTAVPYGLIVYETTVQISQ